MAGEQFDALQIEGCLQIVAVAFARFAEARRPHIGGGLDLEHDLLAEAVRSPLPPAASDALPVERQFLLALRQPAGQRQPRVVQYGVAHALQRLAVTGGQPGSCYQADLVASAGWWRALVRLDEIVGEPLWLQQQRVEGIAQ